LVGALVAGTAAGAFSFLCMGSGALTLLAAASIMTMQALLRQRQPWSSVVAIVVLGLLASGPNHDHAQPGQT
jgi:hypothetical protein